MRAAVVRKRGLRRVEGADRHPSRPRDIAVVGVGLGLDGRQLFTLIAPTLGLFQLLGHIVRHRRV